MNITLKEKAKRLGLQNKKASQEQTYYWVSVILLTSALWVAVLL